MLPTVALPLLQYIQCCNIGRYGEWIEKGFQFTRLAVQEPNGVMILQASYGLKTRFGNYTDFNPYFGEPYVVDSSSTAGSGISAQRSPPSNILTSTLCLHCTM